MNEVEQLRKEINELRERLARLEMRKSAIEHDQWKDLQKLKREWDELEKTRVRPMQPTPLPILQPYWTHDVAKHFPPGTILC